MARIQAVPGIRAAEPRLMRLASVAMMLADGSTVRTLNAMPGLELVFVADGEGRCRFAGAVPWTAKAAYQQTLGYLREEHQLSVLSL